MNFFTYNNKGFVLLGTKNISLAVKVTLSGTSCSIVSLPRVMTKFVDSLLVNYTKLVNKGNNLNRFWVVWIVWNNQKVANNTSNVVVVVVFFWKGLSQFKEVYTRKKTPTRSCFLKYKQRSDAFGLGQTSNFSWEEPNSNLDRTILTFWVRRQTQDASNQSTESDQKEILIHFHPNEAKFTLSNKFLIY